MKRFLTVLVLLALALTASAGGVWMDFNNHTVRWDKPTTLTLDGLQVYSQDFSPADYEKAGFCYVEAPDCPLHEMVIDYVNRAARAMTPEEQQSVIDAQYIPKNPFMVETEKAYTNLLTQVGLPGAWADPNTTYANVGLYMMEHNLVVEMLLADKLFGLLMEYYEAYGGTDLRQYPWGSLYIQEPK